VFFHSNAWERYTVNAHWMDKMFPGVPLKLMKMETALIGLKDYATKVAPSESTSSIKSMFSF